ncbi:SH3 and PX-domain-containing 3 [Mycena venus]|uniref:SH3 and PX-domain-containing 3 n=1 Tax=Mycena venus TaxID=2733690 RepID=A0A8H7D6K0_9AGAR|nr:SH3 and PX-domain-containing 3 [Mycena venus]
MLHFLSVPIRASTHLSAMNSDRLRFRYRWTRVLVCGLGALALLWLLIPCRVAPLTFPSMPVDVVAQQLGHPMFFDIRIYERNLPQHTPPSSLTKGTTRPRYLFFPSALWGSGWNNVLQEQLLNTHLADLSKRAYVYPGYIPQDHPPFPDTLANGTRYLLHIPMNAFVSGPTGGGPLSSEGEDSITRRAVSEEWWHLVCPRSEVVVVNLHDTMRDLRLDGSSEGKEIIDRWADKLLKISSPCVSIEGGSVFDYLFFGSSRVLSLWPSYADSPTLKYFAWSPQITAALFRNFHSFRPYRTSERPIAGLLGIHVRRGDFEWHCVNLVNGDADYNAWNQLGTPGIASSAPADYVWPALPDYLNVPEGQSRKDAAFHHCWPSPEVIVARAHTVREEAASGAWFTPQDLQKIYISTNGDRSWVNNLAALLKADGWDVSGSFDMKLTQEELAVAQAVDMSVLTSAESFIGVGFSSLSSNVVQIRLAGGRDPRTNHFW